MSGAGSCGMGLRQPSVNQGPQGLLPFDFDASDVTDEVTGRAGLPLLLETMMALHVSRAVKQHLKLRKRNAGFSEAEMVEEAAAMRTLVLKIERKQADMFAEHGGIKYLGIVSNDFGEDGAALIRWHYRKAGCIEVVHDVGKTNWAAAYCRAQPSAPMRPGSGCAFLRTICCPR